MQVNTNFSTFLRPLPMEEADKEFVYDTLNRYSGSSAFGSKLQFLVYRITNAIKALFGRSDWQKARGITATAVANKYKWDILLLRGKIDEMLDKPTTLTSDPKELKTELEKLRRNCDKAARILLSTKKDVAEKFLEHLKANLGVEENTLFKAYVDSTRIRGISNEKVENIYAACDENFKNLENLVYPLHRGELNPLSSLLLNMFGITSERETDFEESVVENTNRFVQNLEQFVQEESWGKNEPNKSQLQKLFETGEKEIFSKKLQDFFPTKEEPDIW